MRRAVRVTLKFVTLRKRRAITALLESYRAAVNFYIRSLWAQPGRLDAETLARLTRSRLSQRYRSQALKQALEIVNGTRKSAKALNVEPSMPVFNGAATLDAKFVSVEAGRGSFDLVVRLSTLVPRKRITIPTRRTAVYNKWLSISGARAIQGCSLNEDRLVVWIEIPEQQPAKDIALGVDLGINKLIVDSNGNKYGVDFKIVRDKILRRKRGSKGRRRAYRERDNLINRSINQLPWGEFGVLGVERLHDMKRGKRTDRSKAFRRAVSPWTYRQVLRRLSDKARESRALLVAVNPRNTSRTCPVCSTVSKRNRNGENFLCVSCGYKGDADHVGARNVLLLTLRELGSVESPRPQKDV